MKIRRTRDKFERQRHQMDDIIQKNIVKSEPMAQEFRDMLKGALVKMSDRIEMSRDSQANQMKMRPEAVNTSSAILVGPVFMIHLSARMELRARRPCLTFDSLSRIILDGLVQIMVHNVNFTSLAVSTLQV
jgi:hypothetical protein